MLTLSTLMAGSLAHAWDEPVIAPIMMTAPLTPPPVTGTTYYVDKGNLGGTCNNSNPGTQTQPWCTLGKAAQTLTAGQRAYVRTGTYTEGNLHTTNAGTPGNYITFEAYPGERPVINCTGNTFCWDGVGFSWSYVVWNGFEAFGAGQQFFVELGTNTHHIWFVNGKYHDNAFNFAGFVLSVGNNVISNNEIYNTGMVSIYTSDGHDNIIEFNVFHDNARNDDDAGVIKCGVHDSLCVIRYNLAYNNYRNPSSSVPCPSAPTCQGVTPYYMDFHENTGGNLSYIYNNVAFDNDAGIQVFNSQGVRVFNNIVYHNGFTPGAGTFQIGYGQGINVEGFNNNNIQVYNNTVYNHSNIGLNFGQSPSGGYVSRNNIVMNNTINMQVLGGALNENLDYDLLSGGSIAIRWNNIDYTLASFLARGGNTTWTHAVGTAASFVNAASGDFHLTSTSAGKDAGTPVALFTYDYENHARPQDAA